MSTKRDAAADRAILHRASLVEKWSCSQMRTVDSLGCSWHFATGPRHEGHLAPSQAEADQRLVNEAREMAEHWISRAEAAEANMKRGEALVRIRAIIMCSPDRPGDVLDASLNKILAICEEQD